MKRTTIAAIVVSVLAASASHAATTPAYGNIKPDDMRGLLSQSNLNYNTNTSQQVQIDANTAKLTSESAARLGSDQELARRIAVEKARNDQTDKDVHNLASVNDSQDHVLDNHETRIQDLENAPKPKDGLNGVDGKDGATGATGVAGADGHDGLNGRDGIDGIDGKDGQTGAAGTDGKDGKDGLNGNDGLNGKDGEKGDTGDKGDTGLIGKTGADGKAADMSKVDANTKNITLLSGDITTNAKQSAAAYAEVDARIAQAKKDQATTNQRVAQNTADIANHEQRIGALESGTNAKFGQLKSQIDDNRKRASAGIAGVAAMASIPQVLESQDFNIGAGAGNTDGESAVAVGFSARASKNVVIKASVSTDTQQNFVVGAGVAYGW